MHVNNFVLKRPDHLLDQCVEVIIAYNSKPITTYRTMRMWCWDHDMSLVWSEQVDTSDTSSESDHMAAFYFINEEDAVMFTLKFK